MTDLLNSRYWLWALLAAAFIYLTVGLATGRLFYGEVVHTSGELSVRLLMLAMAATPLLLMFPGRALPRWLMRHRRTFGVASFAFACLHTAVYVERLGRIDEVFAEAAEPGYLTGWLALAVFLPLALTSNDRAVRYLKQAWRRLHRLVYLAALLTFVHWLLVAFSPTAALAHLLLIAALEGYRVWKQAQIRAQASRRP